MGSLGRSSINDIVRPRTGYRFLYRLAWFRVFSGYASTVDKAYNKVDNKAIKKYSGVKAAL